VANAATYLTELVVGLGCLGLAAASWAQGGRRRAIAVVFAVAGLAAVVHAVVSLLG